MKILQCLAALALAAGLLAGCGAAEPLPEQLPAEDARLVIYTSHKEEVYRPIVREFEERTGLWVQVVTGGSSELLERIDKEQSAPRADVMFGGGEESLEAHRDCFQPYRCSDADAIAEAYQAPEDVWTPFSALPVVLIYNTKLVDPQLLTGWSDLLRPEFAGRIAFADPARSGSAFTALITGQLAGCSMEALAEALQGRLCAASGDVLELVADGTCLVGITLEETALKRTAAGDTLAVVYPADGTSSVPDGTAVVKNAPHAENARLFVDFTLNREVQELLGSRFYRRSVRSDVQPGAMLPPMEELTLVNYSARWAAENRQALLRSWANAWREASQ